jgi:hypothetical protein
MVDFNSMKRRDLLKTLSLSAAGATLAGLGGACAPVRPLAGKPAPRKHSVPERNPCSVSRRPDPVAIAMWDFSWLLRHHLCGEFEDWDSVLDGLVERGYTAIRLDVFPNLVAADAQGRVTNEYCFPKSDWKPAMWGNNLSMTANPRQALKEFIPRCVDRGLLLGLSTWFFGPGCEKIQGPDEFVRVWDETLTFLKDNDLLHNIYYVDLLNEYPLFSGFSWLRDQMETRKRDAANRQAEAVANPAQDERKVHEWKAKAGDYNDPVSRDFYISFANNAIDRLRLKWPELDFLFCITNNGSADWRAMDYSRCAALDIHYWFVMNDRLAHLLYWENIHTLAANDQKFSQVQEVILRNWRTNKVELVEWMDARMGEVAAMGRRYNKPFGNTEGWGAINWLDHPALTWEVVQEAGEICARLGRKHGYRFNCTSNFTHPQFPRLWRDVAWHRRVTDIIRQG